MNKVIIFSLLLAMNSCELIKNQKNDVHSPSIVQLYTTLGNCHIKDYSTFYSTNNDTIEKNIQYLYSILDLIDSIVPYKQDSINKIDSWFSRSVIKDSSLALSEYYVKEKLHLEHSSSKFEISWMIECLAHGYKEIPTQYAYITKNDTEIVSFDIVQTSEITEQGYYEQFKLSDNTTAVFNLYDKWRKSMESEGIENLRARNSFPLSGSMYNWKTVEL